MKHTRSRLLRDSGCSDWVTAAYRTDTMLVVKETKATGNGVCVNFGKEVTKGVIPDKDLITE